MFRHGVFLLAAALCAQTTAITGVNVVDVVAGNVIPAQTVLISGDRITAVGPFASTQVPAQSQTIDGTGYYLMPGLWDMHVHFRSNPVDPDRVLAEENAGTLELFLVNGVVGVREMGGDLSEHVLRWREEVKSGKRMGPRILTAGRKLDVQKPAWPGSISTTTPEEGREAVRQMKRAGADFIKVYYGEVEVAVLKAVLAEAHATGLKVVGHLPRNLLLQTAHELGMDEVEHAMYLRTPTQSDWERFVIEGQEREKAGIAIDAAEATRRRMWMHSKDEAKRLYPLMAARPLWITPTLVVESRVRVEIAEKKFDSDPRKKYIDPSIWASWDTTAGQRKPPAGSLLEVLKKSGRQVRELTLEAHKAGVPLLLGTDCGVSNNYVFPGWSVHEELAAMVDAGLAPADALRAATVNPAKWRGELANEGTVEKGKRADLLLLRSNPLTAIGATREIESVVTGGKLHSRRQLDAMLNVVEQRVKDAYQRLK